MLRIPPFNSGGKMIFNIIARKFFIGIFLLIFWSILLASLSFAGTNNNFTSLDSSSDYLVYYGSFDDNKVLQAQYFNLVIVDINGITQEQVDDIKNGLDNIPGTDDDVTVLGYLSIGEQDGALISGDETGPVYWDGAKVIHENKGYASFYLDDKDRNGMPDQDGIWTSWYVNAGDSAWWEFNNPIAADIITVHHCDGLFLDLVDTGGPNSWGLPYQWTAEGMIKYIEYLRKTYPDKYLLANRGIFYFDPQITSHYKYADRYRQSINGLMLESYYAEWDWNKSIGIYNPEHPMLRDHFAPLLNIQAKKPDGFNMFILDYISHSQPNHDQLLDTVVKVAERDQGWMVSVSPILLDTIWFDVYNHHIVDNNPPSWTKTVGASKYKWDGNNFIIYFDEAEDQTPPVKYDLYLSESEIDFASPPQYKNITPLSSDVSDYKAVIENLDPNKTYYAAVRASDSSIPSHEDQNRKVMQIIPGAVQKIKIDGYFDDWGSWNQVDKAGDDIELAGDTLVSNSCDLIDLWYSEDSDNYYFSFSAGGKIIADPYYYHVFIDEDNDTSTGYHSNGSYIGIDLMCENGYLWRYNGTNNEWSWEYLGQIDYQVGISNNKQAEMAIPKSYLNGHPSSISFIYHIDNGNSEIPDDYAPNDYKLRSYHSSDYTNVQKQLEQPKEFKISSIAYPNPFNPSVVLKINFNKPVSDNLQVKIYDVIGRLVYSDIIPVHNQSELKYKWNAGLINNDLSSGVYLYRINRVNTQIFTSGKLVYLK